MNNNQFDNKIINNIKWHAPTRKGRRMLAVTVKWRNHRGKWCKKCVNLNWTLNELKFEIVTECTNVGVAHYSYSELNDRTTTEE